MLYSCLILAIPFDFCKWKYSTLIIINTFCFQYFITEQCFIEPTYRPNEEANTSNAFKILKKMTVILVLHKS